MAGPAIDFTPVNCLHWGMHMPFMQPCPWGQALAQAPQLAGSARRSSSHPLPRLPSQSPKPALHMNVHIELTQAATAFWPLPWQALPQAPQFFTSLASLDSQPLFMELSQSAYPGAQPPLTHLPA